MVALLTTPPPGCWLNHLTVKQLSPTQLDVLPSHEQWPRHVQEYGCSVEMIGAKTRPHDQLVVLSALHCVVPDVPC